MGKIPGGGMLRNFYSSSMSGGKGVQNLLGVKNVKSIKWPQGAKFLKRFRLVAITLSLFNDSMSMIAAGFKLVILLQSRSTFYSIPVGDLNLGGESGLHFSRSIKWKISFRSFPID